MTEVIEKIVKRIKHIGEVLMNCKMKPCKKEMKS